MTGAEWFLGAAILISFCVMAGWAAGGRRRERFVQPPPSWWVCPACHSVNEAGDVPLTCYRCRHVADPATVQRMETTPEFEWTQQLATTRKGGWDREVGWAAEHSGPAPTEATEASTATETTETSAAAETTETTAGPSAAEPTVDGTSAATEPTDEDEPIRGPG